MNCSASGCSRSAPKTHNGSRGGRVWCTTHLNRWSRYKSLDDPKAYLKPISRKTGDLYWAAGFLEGEGCFVQNKSRYKIAQVSAVQVQKEPLTRLRGILGGSVRLRTGRSYQSDFWIWQVNGARARGVLLTLWGLMSPRRKSQMLRALGHDLPHFELVA